MTDHPYLPARYRPAAEIDPDPRWRPFLDGTATEIAFQGPLGTGKTWAATRLLVAWRETHPPEAVSAVHPLHASRCQCPICRPRTHETVCWIDATDAASRIADEWRTEDRGRFAGYLRSVGCLLIDDLGAESGADAIQTELSAVLRHRYNHTLPTILTCQSLDDLEGRIASRFSGLVIGMAGKDRRRYERANR